MIVAFMVFAFVTGSVLYVYRLRGQERYASFTEYFRKGWPIFTPFNCLLYLFTERRAQHPVMDMRKFSELDSIQEHWPTIQKEVLALHKAGYFEQTKKPGETSYYDVGFRTFYKYGWGKFYLNWYGYNHASAKRLCPETVKVLKNISTVNGAMFTVLPPGSKLTRHLDPAATSLRYHLGLSTPNSDDCYINVDGENYSWRDGEAFMFDETYLHFAFNNSDQNRLILMCDVERPMNILGKLFNAFYKHLMRFTIVPNMEGDRRGLANITFSNLVPIFEKSKRLKKRNRPAYLLLKYSVNIILITMVLASITGIILLLGRLLGI